MEELKTLLCDELTKMASKKSITMSDLNLIHLLADTIKDLDKVEDICEMEEEEVEQEIVISHNGF